jgi:hypothetical protein
MQRRVAQVLSDALPAFYDGWEVMAQLLDYAAARLVELGQRRAAGDDDDDAGAGAAGSVGGWCAVVQPLSELLRATLLKEGPGGDATVSEMRLRAASHAARASLEPLLGEVQRCSERGGGAVSDGALNTASSVLRLAASCGEQPGLVLWRLCRDLLVAGNLGGQRAALGLVVTFAEFLVPEPTGAAEAELAALSLERGMPVSAQPPPPALLDDVFWQALQAALLDAESEVRKQARWLLERAVRHPAAAQTLAAHWGSFAVLYDTLDHFAAYLVEAAWLPMDALHPPAEEGGDLAVDFAWMQVLWQRGLTHPNPMVRKHVLRSLLGRDWSPPNAARVPLSFLQRTLPLAFCDPCQHKEFGVHPAGPLHSESTAGFAAFVSAVICALPRAAAWEALVLWVDAVTEEGGVSGAGQGYGRAQLCTVALSVEAVTQSLGPVRPKDQPPGPAPGLAMVAKNTADLQAVEERLLEVLVSLAALSNKEFGVHFKAALLSRLLRLAAEICPAGHARLGLVAAMLQQLPPASLDADTPPEASLRGAVADWLTPPSKLADPTHEKTPAEMLALGLDVATVVAAAAAARQLPLVADPARTLPVDDRWLAGAVLTAVTAFLRADMDDDAARLAAGAATGPAGGAHKQVGDVKSSLGDANISLGDVKISLGDANSSLGDANSSLGGRHRWRTTR